MYEPGQNLGVPRYNFSKAIWLLFVVFISCTTETACHQIVRRSAESCLLWQRLIDWCIYSATFDQLGNI